MAQNDVKIKVSLDGDKLVINGLNGIGDEAGKSDKKLGKFIAGGLKGVAVGAGIAAGALATFIGVSIKAAAEAEKVYVQTAATIESTGMAAGKTSDDIRKLAGSLSFMSGVDDEVIQSGANILLTFTKIQGANFDKATESALNMSVALGTDLNSASILVGKALNDPIMGVSALGRSGVQFSKDQKAMIAALVETGDVAGAQALILAELETQFGGSAAAFGSTFEGALGKVKSLLGDVQQAVGFAFIPALTAGTNRVADLLLALTSSEGFNTFIANLGKFATDLLSGQMSLADIGGSLQEGIKKAADWMANGGIQQIVDSLMSGRAAMFEAGLQVFPAIVEALVAVVPALATGAVQMVTGLVQLLVSAAPDLLKGGLQLFLGLVQGLSAALPSIITAVLELIPVLVTTLVSMVPLLLDGALQMFMGIVQALPVIINVLVGALPNLITSVITALLGAIPLIIQAGITLLTSLVAALPEIITSLVAAIPVIISSVLSAILDSLPMLVQSGIDLFVALIGALPQIIITIVEAIPKIITGIIGGIVGAIPSLIMAGVQLLVALVENMPMIVGTIVKAIPEIIIGIVGALVGAIPQIVKVGGDLIGGLWNGISGAAGWLWDKIAGFVEQTMSNIGKFFGINSPSTRMRDEVGQYLPSGIGAGVVQNEDKALKPISDLNTKIMREAQKLNTSATFKTEANLTQTLIPLQATATSQGPVKVEASLDPTLIAGAITDSFASASRGQEQAAVTLSRESINTLASAIVDSMRVQSRQGVSALG